MKKFICFLSYIGVLGAGVGIGALGTRLYFEKKANDRADSEIASMRAYFEDEYQALVSLDEECPPLTNTVENKETLADIVPFREYHTFTKDISEKAESPKEEDDSKEPYFIDIDDFDEVTLGYGKKELVYYMDDETLVDESENIDEDGEFVSLVETIGMKNLERFENSLESVCYIRNEKLKEDYEISKVFGSYGAIRGDV